jgi:hypothetical protein
MNTGIQYKLTGESARGVVHSYHYKPEPNKLSVTRHSVDIAGLKPRQKRDNFALIDGAIASRFTIGIEVEKNLLHRNSVREYELFCGFEHDGSCGVRAGVAGYEAVSHILPLLPQGQWRTKVYDMFHKARYIIEDQYSPSNSRCGGHMTIGVEGMNGDELNGAMRKFSGIIYALFRHRLKNDFCNHNLRMHSAMNTNLHVRYHHKYQVALNKGKVLEFRVVSRFESVKQLMRRYELMYEVVNVAITAPNTNYRTFLKHLSPLVVLMYNGDTNKAMKVLSLAVDFQKFIDTGEVSQDIRKYLPMY